MTKKKKKLKIWERRKRKQGNAGPRAGRRFKRGRPRTSHPVNWMRAIKAEWDKSQLALGAKGRIPIELIQRRSGLSP